MALSDFGKAVLGAAFLLLVACGGGDSFKANPNAVVSDDQLRSMVAAAAATQGLTQVRSQMLPMPGDSPVSCNDRAFACHVASPPGLDTFYAGSGGSSASIETLIMPAALDAKNRLATESTGETSITVDALRKLTNNVNPGASRPCDTKASGSETNACAYEKYSAPNVGDHALAYASDLVKGHNAAAVFFTRDFLLGHVEVSGSDIKAAKSLANRLAKALDEQMKQALSR